MTRLPELARLILAAVGADMGEAGGVEDVEGVVDAGLPGVGEVARRGVYEVEADGGDGVDDAVRRAEERIGRVLAARTGQAGDERAGRVVRAGDEVGQHAEDGLVVVAVTARGGLAVEPGVHDDVAAYGQRGRREFGGSGGLVRLRLARR